MNFRLTIILSLFLSASFCSKEDDTFQSKGIITGEDQRKCACWGIKCGCCGNYVIQINNSGYIFVDLPKEPKLDLTTAKFPINVSLDWHKDPDSCSLSWGYIIVDRFRLN
ncbi:MAG: hypothetical protein ABI761_18185 [Saprospiraceae bacterium]